MLLEWGNGEEEVLFLRTGSLDPLGTNSLVENNLEKLQTCFLEEVEENKGPFSGTGWLDTLETSDL
jgi:hypothetical protein